MKAKILIVGGGAMGTSIAQHAAQRTDALTEPVVLIEKNQLGSGSSGASGAIVHMAYSDRMLAGMSRDALKAYGQMKASTGRSVGYRRTGVMVIADSDDASQRDRLLADIEMHNSIGIVSHRVGADEIRTLCPGIEVSDTATASFEPEGGFVDARRTIQTFATLARNAGCATRIGMGKPEVMVEKGRAVGVSTEDGEFEAPIVVLAVGPWTSQVLAKLNVELPLQIARVQDHYLEMPPMELVDEEDDEFSESGSGEFETRFIPDPLDLVPVPHPVVIDLSKRFTLRAEPHEQRTRVGRLGLQESETIAGPRDLVGAKDPHFEAWAREAVSARMPIYRDMGSMGGTEAAIVRTPDNLPVVGQVPGIEGLYVVTGFTGNDFHLAPSIGEGVAQMILEQPVSAFDPERLSALRF